MIITLYDMLIEMATWYSTPADQLERAKACGITTKNTKALSSLVRGWNDGQYDEDPEVLYLELIYLIPSKNK